MTDKVALSVQASQEQQNNNAEHQETVSKFVCFKLYVYFERPFETCARNI